MKYTDGPWEVFHWRPRQQTPERVLVMQKGSNTSVVDSRGGVSPVQVNRDRDLEPAANARREEEFRGGRAVRHVFTAAEFRGNYHTVELPS